jgi:hypothetical protein
MMGRRRGALTGLVLVAACLSTPDPPPERSCEERFRTATICASESGCEISFAQTSCDEQCAAGELDCAGAWDTVDVLECEHENALTCASMKRSAICACDSP